VEQRLYLTSEHFYYLLENQKRFIPALKAMMVIYVAARGRKIVLPEMLVRYGYARLLAPLFGVTIVSTSKWSELKKHTKTYAALR